MLQTWPVSNLPHVEEVQTLPLQRITRNRRLTPEEASKYREVREQVARELPELSTRHEERRATVDQLIDLIQQLKAAREDKEFS